MPRQSTKTSKKPAGKNTQNLDESNKKRRHTLDKKSTKTSSSSDDEDISQDDFEKEILLQMTPKSPQKHPKRRQPFPSYTERYYDREYNVKSSGETSGTDIILESAKVFRQTTKSSDGNKRRNNNNKRVHSNNLYTLSELYSNTESKIQKLYRETLPPPLIIIIISIIIMVVCYLVFSRIGADARLNDLDSIKKKFPTQDEILWKAINAGINDTKSLLRPTSYIFLFENAGEKTTRELIAELSKYVVSELTDSNTNAINFTEETLTHPQFVKDYGTIISHLKEKLEQKGLMVIENLQELREEYARSFHNFCDEVTPVVKKSAFFFTFKVDKFEKSPLYDMRKIENILRKNWENIEEDEFGPLYTRISSMILKIHP